MTDVIFKGPNCKLKGKYYQDRSINAPVVLILYPESKIDSIPDSIQSVISLLSNNHFSVFVFNFKRVDHIILDAAQKKEEELFEVISVLNWISEKNTEGTILWLFSFFSTCLTGLQVVMRRPEITDYILFSPSAKVKDFSFIVPCSSVGLVVYESNTSNFAEEITEKLLSRSDSKVITMLFDDINIEKNINLSGLLESLDNYIKEKLSDDTGKIKKIKRDRRRRKKKKSITEEEKNLHVLSIKSLELD